MGEAAVRVGVIGVLHDGDVALNVALPVFVARGDVLDLQGARVPEEQVSQPHTRRLMRLAVLASHEGTTLQAILDAIVAGRLSATMAVVVSNNRESGALRRARAAGVPAVHLSSATHPDPEDLDLAILETLEGARVDLVLLAGYLKKLGAKVLRQYRGRIVNTHPALLPKFGGKGMYGSRVHQAVLAAGDSETGVSVHLVDAEYDTGRVIAQCRVPVFAGDSVDGLASRVQEREREFVVETLAALAANVDSWRLANQGVAADGLLPPFGRSEDRR